MAAPITAEDLYRFRWIDHVRLSPPRSALPVGVGAPKWLPDGKRIAFLGAGLADPDAVVADPRPAEGREQLRRAPVARVVRPLDSKYDGLGYFDGRHHPLFVVS